MAKKTSTVKQSGSLVYEGLGFPIELLGFPTKKVRDVVLPDIDLNELQKMVFRALVTKESRFSGAEVKFIRSYLRETQSEFAKNLNQANHSIVSQWEAKGTKFTGMEINTEVVLRVYMFTSMSSALKRAADPFWRKIVPMLFDALHKIQPASEVLHVEFGKAA